MKIKNASFYFAGDIVEKLIPFILIPILTRYLSADDYGYAGVAISIFQIFLILVAFNIRSFLPVAFFKKGGSNFNEYVTSFYIICICITIFISFFIPLIYEIFLYQFNVSLVFYELLLFAALGNAITYVLLTIYRINEKPEKYILLQISLTAINFGISIFLVVLLNYGLVGRLLGVIISGIFIGIISFFILNKFNLKICKPSTKIFKEISIFCIPLWPHVLSNWVRSNIDRIFIAILIGPKEAAIYIVGQQLSVLINFAAIAFNKAYQPYLFSLLPVEKHDETKRVFNKTVQLTILVIFVSFIYGIFANSLLPFYVGPEFQDAKKIIPLLAIGAGINSAYVFLSNYVLYFEKTAMLSTISIASSLIQAILSYFFILKFGIIGAAYAVICSYGFLWIVTLIQVNKLLNTKKEANI